MQIGDRVKVPALDECGRICDIDPRSTLPFKVFFDSGREGWFKAPDLKPVTVTVLEGEVHTISYTDGTVSVTLDDDHVNDLIRPFRGKRVRITIEELD